MNLIIIYFIAVQRTNINQVLVCFSFKVEPIIQLHDIVIQDFISTVKKTLKTEITKHLYNNYKGLTAKKDIENDTLTIFNQLFKNSIFSFPYSSYREIKNYLLKEYLIFCFQEECKSQKIFLNKIYRKLYTLINDNLQVYDQKIRCDRELESFYIMFLNNKHHQSKLLINNEYEDVITLCRNQTNIYNFKFSNDITKNQIACQLYQYIHSVVKNTEKKEIIIFLNLNMSVYIFYALNLILLDMEIFSEHEFRMRLLFFSKIIEDQFVDISDYDELVKYLQRNKYIQLVSKHRCLNYCQYLDNYFSNRNLFSNEKEKIAMIKLVTDHYNRYEEMKDKLIEYLIEKNVLKIFESCLE